MYIGDRLMQNMHPPPPTRVVETAAREPIPERMVRLIHRRPHLPRCQGYSSTSPNVIFTFTAVADWERASTYAPASCSLYLSFSTSLSLSLSLKQEATPTSVSQAATRPLPLVLEPRFGKPAHTLIQGRAGVPEAKR